MQPSTEQGGGLGLDEGYIAEDLAVLSFSGDCGARLLPQATVLQSSASTLRWTEWSSCRAELARRAISC